MNTSCNNETNVLQPVKEFTEDNVDKPQNSKPEITFNDRANLAYVRNDVPVKDVFEPRRSMRNVKKPCRLIEECEVNVRY